MSSNRSTPPPPRTRSKKSPEEKALNKQLGLKIKAARIQKGLSQHDVSRQLDITAGAVGQWERGANRPLMATFEKLAQLLELDWKMSDYSPEERGIARDVGESVNLEAYRKAPQEAKVAATALLESWPTNKPVDRAKIVHLNEAFIQLSESAQMAALAMIDGLGSRETPQPQPASKPAFKGVATQPKALPPRKQPGKPALVTGKTRRYQAPI